MNKFDAFNALHYIGRTNSARFCKIYNNINPIGGNLWTKELFADTFISSLEHFTFFDKLQDNQYFKLHLKYDFDWESNKYSTEYKYTVIEYLSVLMIQHLVKNHDVDISEYITQDDIDAPFLNGESILTDMFKSDTEYLTDLYKEFVFGIYRQLDYIPNVIFNDGDVKLIYKFMDLSLEFIISPGYSVHWNCNKLKCYNKICYFGFENDFDATNKTNNIAETINNITEILINSCGG